MATKRAPKAELFLGSLEARIMSDVWKHGGSTVNEVLERLNRRAGKKLAYNTVMSVMARLADKKILVRTREGRAYRYRPAMNHDEFIVWSAEQAVNELLADFGPAFVDGAVRAISKDPELSARLTRKLRAT